MIYQSSQRVLICIGYAMIQSSLFPTVVIANQDNLNNGIHNNSICSTESIEINLNKLYTEKDPKAFNAIISCGDNSTKSLIKRLNTTEGDSLNLTIAALGEIGESSRLALPELVDLSVKLFDKSVKPGMSGAMECDGNEQYESHSLIRKALNKMGSSPEKWIIAIRPLLNHPSTKVRVRAVIAFSKLGRQETIKYILPLLEDSSEQVRISARLSIDSIKSLNDSSTKKIQQSNLEKFNNEKDLYLELVKNLRRAKNIPVMSEASQALEQTLSNKKDFPQSLLKRLRENKDYNVDLLWAKSVLGEIDSERKETIAVMTELYLIAMSSGYYADGNAYFSGFDNINMKHTLIALGEEYNKDILKVLNQSLYVEDLNKKNRFIDVFKVIPYLLNSLGSVSLDMLSDELRNLYKDELYNKIYTRRDETTRLIKTLSFANLSNPDSLSKFKRKLLPLLVEISKNDYYFLPVVETLANLGIENEEIGTKIVTRISEVKKWTKKFNEVSLIRRLGRISPSNSKVFSLLVSILKNEKYSEFDDLNMVPRQAAIYALRDIGSSNKQVIPILIETLESNNDQNIRTAAIRVLADIGGDNPTAVKALIKASNDSYFTRSPGRSSGNVDRSLSGEPYFPIRHQSIISLSEVDPKFSKEVIPVLISAFKDPDVAIRNSAIESSGVFGAKNKEVLPQLIDLLLNEREDIFVRAAAVKSIRKINSKEALKFLQNHQDLEKKVLSLEAMIIALYAGRANCETAGAADVRAEVVSRSNVPAICNISIINFLWRWKC